MLFLLPVVSEKRQLNDIISTQFMGGIKELTQKSLQAKELKGNSSEW